VSANAARHASAATAAPAARASQAVDTVHTMAGAKAGAAYGSSGGAGAGGDNVTARAAAAAVGLLAVVCSGLYANSKRQNNVAHAEAEETAAGDADPLADTKLYPQPPLLEKRTIKVSKLHTISYSLYGNPKGKPVLFVHGGPGGGTAPAMARYFNPEKYYIILVDQRGAQAVCAYVRVHV